MGKATIISHAGKGQYTVDVAIETQYVQQQIDKFQEEHTRLHYVDFPAAEAEKISEELKLSSAQHDVDIAISNYYADPTDANYAEIQRLTDVALNQSQSFRVAKGNYEAILTRIDALRRRLETLRANNQKYKRSALWCIDLADGKKDRKLFYPGDEVGTAEISGDIDTGQNLLASYSPGWEYDIQRDGMLVNINALTPFEFLYDNTLFPPWQKWEHRYRSATITDGNPTDGWTILLDDTKSTEQAIEVNTVNSTRTLTGIHAVYMSCNDRAFGIKDHVVVDLTVSGPGNATVLAATIIGFVEKPKPCLISGFGYYALETDGTPQEWQHVNDETGIWVKQPSYANDLTAHAMDGGGEPTIRSWIGDDVDSESQVLEFLTPSIYLSGNKIADRPSDRSWSIIGAAMSPNRKFLWAIFCDGPISNKISIGRYPINEVTPEWEMQEFDLGANAIVGSIEGQFSFNASCTRALSMWGFLHGAKRVPQSPPAPGSTWSSSISNYSNTWKEKLEIIITAPDAETMVKAGVSLTNSGRQGYLVYNYSNIDQISAYVVGGTITRNVDVAYSWSGNYLMEIGFRDDEEVGIYKQGIGSGVSTETGINGEGAGGGTASFVLSENLGIYLTVPTFEVSIPLRTQSASLSSTANTETNPRDYASGYFTYTYADINTINTDALLLAVDSIAWDWSGNATYFPTPPDWNSTETERYTEQGYLYCGPLIDSSSSFDETIYVDRQPGNFVFVGVPTVPDEDTPGSTFEQTYSYDYTEYNLSMLSPTKPYEKIQGARAAGRKHIAYWQNTRTPGGVREYKAYLTGGDPFTLDGLTGDVIYRAIHPL